MSTSRVSKYKIKTIRQNWLDKHMSYVALSKKIGVHVVTIAKHRNEFIALGEAYPEQAQNVNFFLPKPKKIYPPTKRLLELRAFLPGLLAQTTANKASVPAIFQRYSQACPAGYKYDTFRKRFATWHKTQHICLFAHKKVAVIYEEDKKLLEKWQAGNDLIAWRHASVIMDSFNGVHLKLIATRVNLSIPTLLTYIAKYNEGGLANVKRKYGNANKYWVASRTEKKANLMKLIHQSPRLHGIYRSSWRLADLSQVYWDLYGVNVSSTAISLYFRQEGFVFRKAKLTLTSPDPLFREKLNHLQNILSNLGPAEKFFSIDEYGPFAIKMHAGYSYMRPDNPKTVKTFQKNKGWAICTAALELSTNQVTHFYSLTKDTAEMIKLIDLLVLQYSTDKKLYMSWDAASWHNSKQLKNHIQKINTRADKNSNTTPYVELAPLPASAQFLNVIESVFSGLAKAVVHNSNYETVNECKTAIDMHFATRNAHYKKHPKKAGKMIWGKEMVKPVFHETNNCKDPLALR